MDNTSPANIGSDDGLSDGEPILAEGWPSARVPANIGTHDNTNTDDIPDDAFEPVTPVADPANIGWSSRPRIERTGSLKAPDGKGAFWVWRWWELDEAGAKKVRKSRYGGKVQTETAREYWGAATANIG